MMCARVIFMKKLNSFHKISMLLILFSTVGLSGCAPIDMTIDKYFKPKPSQTIVYNNPCGTGCCQPAPQQQPCCTQQNSCNQHPCCAQQSGYYQAPTQNKYNQASYPVYSNGVTTDNTYYYTYHN